MALSAFVRQRLAVDFSSPSLTDLELIAAMLTDGLVVSVVDRAFTLGETPEAIRYLRAGRARGKVVIVV